MGERHLLPRLKRARQRPLPAALKVQFPAADLGGGGHILAGHWRVGASQGARVPMDGARR